MSPPIELPADEFERLLAKRRAKAVQTIGRYGKWWLGAQVLTVVFGVALTCIVFLIESTARGERDFLELMMVALTVGFSLVGFFMFEVSVVVAVVALRDWSLLPKRRIVAAGAIWLLVVTELLGGFLVLEHL
jgi:hypothetical protein